jgi:hypothetical protein
MSNKSYEFYAYGATSDPSDVIEWLAEAIGGSRSLRHGMPMRDSESGGYRLDLEDNYGAYRVRGSRFLVEARYELPPGLIEAIDKRWGE